MTRTTLAHGFFALCFSACGFAWAAPSAPSADPLAAIDLNRNAIIADIVQGFEGDRAALAKRLSELRADRLLSASLASSREGLESILGEAEKSRDAAVSRASAKSLGSPNSDLIYTPLTPCRLIDTRGFGAPIQGGAFAPNARRAYAPNGLCSLPTSGVATILISFTTQNLSPNSGGYLAILAPSAPVTASVDVFNLGAEWSASNTAVITGSAAQFDVLVASANAHVVIDVLGYFAPPQGTVVKSITAGAGLTGGTITDTGTVGLAAAFQLPQACTNGQVATSNGAGGWSCVTPVVGGTLIAVTATAPLESIGGNAPNISLAGIVPVANGGTGQAGFAPNAILYGQGAAPVGMAIGTPGQVLAGTPGAPAFTGSPSLNGNITLFASTPGTGNIMKGPTRFIHNYGVVNTFIGEGAGNFTMTGAGNTVSGANAFISNTTGDYNTAGGLDSLRSNTTGNHNTATGNAALYFNSIGAYNTATGDNALAYNSSGSYNTAGGANALIGNTSGSSNIGIGYYSGLNLTTGNFNIDIGNLGVAGEGNTIRIGDTNQNRTFIAGISGVTSSGGVAVFVNGSGQLGTFTSSRRFKDDIADMDAASSALMNLRPVTFHYKSDQGPTGRTLQYGLIAEEVAEVYPGLVAQSADGKVETVMYQYLPTMLLNEVQKQQRVIEAQAAEMAEFRQQMVRMTRILERQTARLVKMQELARPDASTDLQ